MHVLMRLAVAILRCMYAITALFTKPQDQIAFLSRQSNSPSLDITLLTNELANRHANIRVVVMCKTLDRSLRGVLSYGFHLLAQMRVIAQSRVLVLDGYSILASILPKRTGLVIVQMGHSMGTMKRFGHTVLGRPEGSSAKTAKVMSMHANYDIVLASSPAYYDDLVAGYNCSPAALRTYPLPRYDALKSSEYKAAVRHDILQRYPRLASKPIVVYCPTFRKNEIDHQHHIDELVNTFPFDSHQLVIKMHPLSQIMINDSRVETLPEFSSFQALFIADAVVSDYSCIVYEAGLLHTPLYFFAFDLDEYDVARGLAINFEREMPGPICRDATSLVEKLIGGSFERERLDGFINRYVSPTNHATSDIADMLLEQLVVARGQ